MGGVGLFDHADAEHAAGLGKLHGVAGEIEQDLVQPQLVADDVLVDHIHGVDEELELFGAYVGLDDGFQVVEDVRKVDVLFLDLDHAAFDPAHVQNVVDQGEQVFAGHRDLFQVVRHLLLVVNVGRGQGGKADDGVHGGCGCRGSCC